MASKRCAERKKRLAELTGLKAHEISFRTMNPELRKIYDEHIGPAAGKATVSRC